MTDFTLAQRGLQDKSYLEGMRDMLNYMNYGTGMAPFHLVSEIQRVRQLPDARKLEPYRKSEAMLQMREIAQQEMEQDNE